MTRYILFFLLFFVAQNSSAQKSKANYPYQLYLPEDYKKHPYPLVIYLHGGSQRGSDLSKLNVYGYPYLISQGRQFPFIIAAPQCPDGKFWSSDNWLDSLYSDLTAKYRIDTNRVYLTGISMGGYGVWQTAVAYPYRFAAIMPLCGGCDDSTMICNIKNVPVWTFHGTADPMVDFGGTARLVENLKACGGNVKFTQLEGEGHEIQYLFEKPELYEWLLQQKK